MSHEVKFTPGPWSVLGPYIVGASDPAKGMRAAPVVMNTESLIDNPRANAALIKAAPRLYSALYDAVKRLRAAAESHGNPPEVVDAFAQQFEDVLKAARGES